MPIVWYLSSVQFSDKTLVSGVILKKKPFISSPGNSPLKNALMIIGSYFNAACSNRDIVVKLKDQKISVKTDEYGGFRVTFDFCADEQVSVYEKKSSVALKAIQNYPIQFQNSESTVAIISDIDDSIMVSYTKTKIKRLVTTLFKPSHKRKVILFTEELYKAHKENNPRFFYVSKSESNLFPTISNFIRHHRLPEGNLFLTPYLSFWQLIKSNKDKNHKFNIISYLIENSPKQRFVLIGDDSQRDIEIYTRIAHQYKSKLQSIYIRQTQKKLNGQKRQSWEALQKTGIGAYYFEPEEIFSLTHK